MKVKLKKERPFRNKEKVSDGLDSEDFEQSKKWYEDIPEEPKQFDKVTDEQLISLKDEAKKCYDSDCLTYGSKNRKGTSDNQWIKTILSKGTASDKIAAYTVSIQDDPLHNLENIRNLVNMVKVSKKECNHLIEVLSELFLKNLLHPSRKLKQFQERPLSLLDKLSSGNAVTRRKYLCYWYFEDQLKETYTTFVMSLNKIAHDTVDANKEKAIGAMYKLLAENAEQEKNLLAYIVNKLGDPSQKVASKAIYCLTQLLRKHSNMQGVVLLEVEKLLFRTNISKRAQYYALCFLSQYYLSHDESEIAKRLIEVYFSFFKACIKLGDVDSRMMSALLIGVNRAYPYAKLELNKISEHIDAIYKIVHIATFNVSLNALSLLYQVSDYCDVINDRFYTALYKKLLDPEICQTAHQAVLLNLIYKALKKDKEQNRVKVFIKRLLQISLYMIPSMACGILYLVSNLIYESPLLKALELKNCILNEDDEEEKYTDVKDPEEKENEKDKIEEETGDTNTEEKEKIESEEDKKDINNSNLQVSNEKSKAVTSWVYQNSSGNNNTKKVLGYDGLNRNPLYAGGQFCSYLELTSLVNHFHPTVSLFAKQILNGEVIKYSGDPLKDFTLIRFLDRFVFKNPKKMEDIEKKGCHPTFGKRNTYVPKGIKSISIKSDSYISQSEKNIPVDERFLFLYLQKKKTLKLEREDKEEESDVESVGSEEFEEMLGKMSDFKGVDDDLDYMNDIGENLKKKGKKKKDEDDSNDEDNSEDDKMSDDDFPEDDEDITNLGDEDLEDLDDEDKELIDGLSDDEEASDLEFNSGDEASPTDKKLNMKKVKENIKSIFASADEFASVLEEEGSSKIAPGSAQALYNKDNADAKQLTWEVNRNRWIKGFDKYVGNKRKRPNKYKKNKKPKNQ